MKNTAEASEADNKDSGVLSNPLSFLRGGDYNSVDARKDDRSNYGLLWSTRSHSTAVSNYLIFGGSGLNPQSGNNRGHGFAVHCVGTSKSFTTLINISYSMKNTGQTEEDNRGAGLLSNPLSFLRSGYFYWDGAILGARGTHSLYWTLHSFDKLYTRDLYFHNASINFDSVDVHGFGTAVRCSNPSPLSLILVIL